MRLLSPVSGRVIALSEVSDPVFAEGMMGRGIGIVPREGRLLAPYAGTVQAMFPTGHALALVAGELNCILHIGVDTVTLQGEGFKAYTQQGASLEEAELALEFEPELISSRGLDPVVIFVFPDGYSEIEKLEAWAGREVKAGQLLVGD